MFKLDANLSSMNKGEVTEWARHAQDVLLKKVTADEDTPDDVGLQKQIAVWLTASTGIKHIGKQIKSYTIERNRVVYILNGEQEVRGITLKSENGTELVDPPLHEHEYRQEVYGAPFVCSCGEQGTEPAKPLVQD